MLKHKPSVYREKLQHLFLRSFLDVNRNKINYLQCIAAQTTLFNYHMNIIVCPCSLTSPLYLLEVNKSRFVRVQQESPSIGTDWVSADVWLCVFKLLFHIFNHRLAVEAQEGSTYKLRMDWVGTYHLSTDTHQ